MSAATQYRWGGFAAIIAGVLYATQAIIGLIKPQGDVFISTTDYLIEIAFIGALVLTLLALIGIRQAAAGVFGLISFLVLFLGTACLMVSASASLAAGRNVLDFLFMPGVGLSALGSILMGSALIRSKIAPLWSGIALIAGFPLSLFLDELGGGAILGVAWVVVGIACLTKLMPRTHSVQPA